MRAARACASARPAGLSGASCCPCQRRSRFNAVSPWRTSSSSASLRTLVAASRASPPLRWRGGAGTRGPWLPGHRRHGGHRAGYRAGAGAAGARVAVVGRDAERAAAVAGELERPRCAGRAGHRGRSLDAPRAASRRWPPRASASGGSTCSSTTSGPRAPPTGGRSTTPAGCARSSSTSWPTCAARARRSPHLRASDQARIVNVASTSGKRPSTGMPDYSVTKAAVLSFSRLLADAHAREGILVNAVCPGPTLTPAWLAARRTGRPERRARRQRSRGRARRRRRGPSAGPSGGARGDRERDRISVLGPRRATSPAPPGAPTAAPCRSSSRPGRLRSPPISPEIGANVVPGDDGRFK